MVHDVLKNRCAFETLGIIYPTTQLNMPEYLSIQQRRCENISSCRLGKVWSGS